MTQVTITHNDGSIEILGGDTPPVPGSLVDSAMFDENGIGLEPLEGTQVCFRVQAVDEAVRRMAMGDAADKAIAAKALQHGQYFALVLPYRDNFERGSELFKRVHYNRPQAFQFASGWTGKMLFPAYRPGVIGQVDQSKSDEENDLLHGLALPGVVCPTFGFDPQDDWEDVGERYVAQLTRDANALRRSMVPGAILPEASPTRD